MNRVEMYNTLIQLRHKEDLIEILRYFNIKLNYDIRMYNRIGEFYNDYVIVKEDGSYKLGWLHDGIETQRHLHPDEDILLIEEFEEKNKRL